jgi:putative transposase
MGSYKKLNHSIYECKYHLVWIPKYRFKVMEGRIRYYVRDKIRQLCEWKKFEIIQGNVQPEHIHLVFWIPPTWAVYNAIGYLKGKSDTGIKNFGHQVIA